MHIRADPSPFLLFVTQHILLYVHASHHQSNRKDKDFLDGQLDLKTYVVRCFLLDAPILLRADIDLCHAEISTKAICET